jgi:hypothetical protein
LQFKKLPVKAGDLRVFDATAIMCTGVCCFTFILQFILMVVSRSDNERGGRAQRPIYRITPNDDFSRRCVNGPFVSHFICFSISLISSHSIGSS